MSWRKSLKWRNVLTIKGTIATSCGSVRSSYFSWAMFVPTGYTAAECLRRPSTSTHTAEVPPRSPPPIFIASQGMFEFIPLSYGPLPFPDVRRVTYCSCLPHRMVRRLHWHRSRRIREYHSGHVQNGRRMVPLSRVYGHASMIQSSGSGKSRLVDEVAKKVFAIPFNLREQCDDPSSRLFRRLILRALSYRNFR